MKNQTLHLTVLTLICATTLSSCSIVGDIFQAGMGFGIFIVVAIVALVFYFISKAGKK